ncbi:phage tail protein [Nitrospirillum amazonense]|uniref:phage tail protein n=1 Tax=Nitrospirillum amazonense TaxID=28077 RepID=UPI002DD42748|nr:phage tail protein [Nitrospirillum amazonense]MEC4591594.1 phage tail protein [Nitrospirillum amazonense]
MSGLFGGGKTNADTKPSYTGLQVQTSAAGLPIPLLWGTQRAAPNLFWNDGFTSKAVASDTGGGKGGGAQSTTQVYSCAVAMGLCEGPIVGVGRVWADKTDTSLGKLNLTLFTGADGQTPFTALYTANPDQALAYPHTAYVASPSYDLGSSASLPNHNFEVQSNAVSRTGPSAFDANPADILVDFLTNERYGVGLTTDSIGDLSAWRSYCAAAGFLMSPLLAQQEAASDIVNRWAQLTNTLIYWSGDQVRALPLGDQPLTGNGVTFTPDLTPVYDLTDDDFIAGSGDDPVTLSRSDPADATNTAKLEFKDRDNSYQTAVAEVRDLAAIDAYGLRTGDPVQAHEICNATTASAIATLILQRQLYVRNTYQFKLAWTFALLEPGDIVTLTDVALGLAKFPVRITQIDEDEEGLLTFTAEELPAGIGTATLYPTPVTSNTPLNTGVDPGDLADPVIFEPSPGLSGGVQQVWIGACGVSPSWGGCSVWVSVDDLSYQRVGQITAPARLGTLGQDLAAGATDAYVSLATGRLKLAGGSADDAAAGRTLSLVGAEMLAYGPATLTGSAAYHLTGLNRGLYGTGAIDHPAGTPFLRLDEAVFKYDLPAAYIGQTLYIKLSSFNIFQAAERSLAEVDAYLYSPVGAVGVLPAPTGLTLAVENAVLADGTVQLGIRARWTPADAGMATDTVLRWGVAGSGGVTDWQQVKVPAGSTDTLLTPVTQAVTYTVQAASSIGTDVRSAWGPAVSIEVGGVLGGASVTHLELYGQGLDTEFVGRDIHLVWQGNFPATSASLGNQPYGAGSGYVNPYFQAYAVTVIEPDSGAVLRTDLVTVEEYYYTFEMNAKDAGGPHRRLTFSVTIRDKLGGESKAATLTVNNPVPAQVQLTALPTTASTLFGFIAPTGADALDFAGVNVWVGASATVDTSGQPAASGSTAPLVVAGLTAGQTYYAVCQTFDTFGTGGCPISAPLQFLVPYVTSAQIAANTIGKDKLVTDLVNTLGLVTGGTDVAGSVAAQVAAEAAARVQAMQEEVTARAQAIQAEAATRAQAILDSASQLQAHIDTVSQAQQTTANSLATTTTTLTAAINGNAAAIQAEQTARANGDSANATAITTLASEVHSPTTGLAAAFSAISNEASTRATADSANASATSALAAQVNDSSTGLAKTRADLVTEQTTRANADNALSTSLTSLTAYVGPNPNLCPDIGSWTLGAMAAITEAQAGLIGYLANPSGVVAVNSPPLFSAPGATYTITGDSQMILNAGGSGQVYFDLIFKDAAGNVLLDGPQNPISTSHGLGAPGTRAAHAVTATAPAGTAQMVARFVAGGLSNCASIAFRQVKVESGAVATVYTQEGQALATSAAIQTEQTARANADSALSASISSLSAQVNDSATGLPKTRADLATEQTARANGDSALSSSISTLSAQVNNASTGLPATYAGLQSEITARASGDSANATSITTLSTTVNGNTASITTLQSSVNGLNAQWVLKTDINGYVAGIGLANSGSSSTFIIRADTLALVPPNSTTTQSPFFVTSSGQVVINNAFIQNLSANVLTSGTIGASIVYAGTISANQITSGSVGGLRLWANATGVMGDGSAGIYIDGVGKNITVGDGTRTRAVMGNWAGTYGFASYDAAGRQLFDSNDLGVGVASGTASVSAYQDGSSITASTKGAWTTITSVPAFQVRGNPCDIKVTFSASIATTGSGGAHAYSVRVQVLRTNTRTGATSTIGLTLTASPYQGFASDGAFSDPSLDTYTYALQAWRPADNVGGGDSGGTIVYDAWQFSGVTMQVRWFR